MDTRFGVLFGVLFGVCGPGEVGDEFALLLVKGQKKIYLMLLRALWISEYDCDEGGDDWL